MAGRPSLPVIRLKIPCHGEREFQERFAGRYAAAGVFVPTEKLRPPGSHVRLILEFRDGSGDHVSGEAVVTSHPTVSGRKGMKLRFLTLDPDSIRFELAPSADAPVEAPFFEPLSGPVAPLQHPQATDLGAELFAGHDLPDTAASRPLEVRSQPVTLRVKEAQKKPAPEPEVPELDPDEVESIEPAAEEKPGSQGRYEELFGPDEFAGEAEPETAPSSAPREEPPTAAPAMPTAVIAAGQAAPRRSRSRRPRRWLRVALSLAAAAVAVELYLAWPSLRGFFATLSPSNPADPELRLADDRASEGRLVGNDGDAALDHLLRARQLAPPGDPRIRTRLKMLADKLEELGELAVTRGNQSEAAAHLTAALRADPSRSTLEQRLAQIKQAKAAPSDSPSPSP